MTELVWRLVRDARFFLMVVATVAQGWDTIPEWQTPGVVTLAGFVSAALASGLVARDVANGRRSDESAGI